MKHMEEFEARVTLPDGEVVPVFLSVKDRNPVVRPSMEEDRFRYLTSIPAVMEQVRDLIAERAGHIGSQDTSMSPMGAGTISPMIESYAPQPVQQSMLAVPGVLPLIVGTMQLAKGARYALVTHGTLAHNLTACLIGPQDDADSVAQAWAGIGVPFTGIMILEG